jgi:hypothetical protein
LKHDPQHEVDDEAKKVACKSEENNSE